MTREKNKALSMFSNADGSTNVGYVVLFWFGGTLMFTILVMLGGAVWETYTDPLHKFPYLPFGQGAGLISTAFLPVLAGISAFLWADSKNPQLGTLKTSSSAAEETKFTPPADMPKSA